MEEVNKYIGSNNFKEEEDKIKVTLVNKVTEVLVLMKKQFLKALLVLLKIGY